MAPQTNGSTAVATTPEIIVWPKAKIGKQILEVRWGIVAEYIISLWNIDVNELLALYRRKMISAPVLDEDGKTVKTPAVFEPMPAQWLLKFFDLFAACVAHNYVQIGQEAPRGSYWVSQVDEDQDQFPGLFAAVTEAMGKRPEMERKKQEKAQTPPPPGMEPQPTVQ